jgi:hypothetical protein
MILLMGFFVKTSLKKRGEISVTGINDIALSIAFLKKDKNY